VNLSRVTRIVARLGFQSLGERIATNVVGVVVFSSVGLVVLGFVVAFHACRRWLVIPIALLAAGVSSSPVATGAGWEVIRIVRSTLAVLCLVALVGCAAEGVPMPTGGLDGSAPRRGAAAAATAVDAQAADLAALPDLALAPDLRPAPDLAPLPDLTPADDIAPTPDLAAPPDLAPAPDLKSAVDMDYPVCPTGWQKSPNIIHCYDGDPVTGAGTCYAIVALTSVCRCDSGSVRMYCAHDCAGCP
jgi:hypothetical protein